MLLGGSWTRAAAEEEIHDLLKKGRDDITEKDMAACLDIECRNSGPKVNWLDFPVLLASVAPGCGLRAAANTPSVRIASFLTPP